MSFIVRKATLNDVEPIWIFWASVDDQFRCTPNTTYPNRDQLERWIDSAQHAVVVVEIPPPNEVGGPSTIISSQVFNLSSKQSTWTNVSDADFLTCERLTLNQMCEWYDCDWWCVVGFVPAVARHVEAGWVEDSEGVLHWAEP